MSEPLSDADLAKMREIPVRQDVPVLLTEVDRLRAELEQARAEIAKWEAVTVVNVGDALNDIQQIEGLKTELDQARAEIARLTKLLDYAADKTADDDDWPATPCEVCGHGCLYGSRHSQCGALVQKVERLTAANLAMADDLAGQRNVSNEALYALDRATKERDEVRAALVRIDTAARRIPGAVTARATVIAEVESLRGRIAALASGKEPTT